MARLWPMAVCAFVAAPASAQAWNSEPALALVRRAIARRAASAADTALRDFKAHAHGFVFFLGQFGEGLTPPRLIKADQLESEVYWKAPGLSKQRIIGWRHEAALPTDIVYHRDHLGIIQNNFGSGIRVGDGDEVRDVPHPFAPDGLALYDFALGDTTSLALPDRTVRVVAVQARPKDFDAPRVVGTLTVDVETGDLVRLAFTFTARAYLDATLDDVSIVLDNALWEHRFWLPYRQEIAIRRHTTWVDFPAWGIIRTRWVVDGYELNVGLAAAAFAGEEIVAAPAAERDSFPWPEPLSDAIQGVADPVRQADLTSVRAAAARIAGARVLTGLAPRRLGVERLSDLVHVNRVEGLALGAGAAARLGAQTAVRARAAYGFADHAPTATVDGDVALGAETVTATVYREVRDVADLSVVTPLVNSFSAQECGADYGDYYRQTGGGVFLHHALGARGEWRGGIERTAVDSLPVRARPATGSYRPNPAFPSTTADVLRLAIDRVPAGVGARRDVWAALSLEGGRLTDGSTYTRGWGSVELAWPIGSTSGLVRLEGGAASAALPAYRAFVLGGRGTLLGDAFRQWGGRDMALIHVEWRAPIPFVAVGATGGASVPTSATLAPFVAVGAAGDAIPDTPWAATPVRVSVGIAFEWLGLIRVETAVSAETGAVHAAFDVTDALRSVL